jgi:hypothetical protein
MARKVTLVVEDGSIVTGANSFVTEAQIASYAAARGVTLPTSSDDELDAVAILGVKAADYLQVQPWKGEVVSTTQTMPFPRKNMNVTPTFPDNAVPLDVVEAQLQLTLFANNGIILLPSSMGSGTLIKEKIGPIENVYSEKIGLSADGLPLLPGIVMLLSPWLLGSFDGIVPTMIWSIGDKSYGC